MSASAAAKPKLNLVKPNSNSFDVVWNRILGAYKYRLYFGAANSNNNGWRRYADIELNNSKLKAYPYNKKSVYLNIGSKVLNGGLTWVPYGDDYRISTPYLNTDQICYKCQVAALDKNGKPYQYTNVGYLLNFKPLSYYVDYNKVTKGKTFEFYPQLIVEKNGGSANSVDIAFKYDKQTQWTKLENNDFSNTLTDKFTYMNFVNKSLYTYDMRHNILNYTYGYFQVRPTIMDNRKVVAYGSWTKIETFKLKKV